MDVTAGPPRSGSSGDDAGKAATREGPAAGIEAHVLVQGRLEVVHSLDEVAMALADPDARMWIDVEDATEATLNRLTAILELHDLVAEDIVERRQRAKIVAWDEGLHLVVFALAHDGELIVSEVDIVLGRRSLLTSHPASWQPTEALREVGLGVSSLLAEGVDMILYALLDTIVDGYFPVIDRLSDGIDELESDVMSRAHADIVERIFRLRRSLLEVRHLVSPEREIFNQLSTRQLRLIAPDRRVYFRDLYDHAIRATDELDTHRELVGGILDAYLTSVNNNLSDVMKRLTAITAVVAGVGAAAGIFGMSEAALALGLPAPLGFWLVAGVVAVIGVLVFAYFRRIDWI